MLVNPSIDDLLTKVDNKFELVTLAMKRARQINAGDPEMKRYNSAKPISRALQEINDKDVFVKATTDETAAPFDAATELMLSLGEANDSELNLDAILSDKTLDGEF